MLARVFVCKGLQQRRRDSPIWQVTHTWSIKELIVSKKDSYCNPTTDWARRRGMLRANDKSLL